MLRLVWVAVSLVFLPLSVLADDAVQLKSLLDRVSVMEGQFEQELFDAQGAPIQSSSGAFSLKRPGYFRWHSEQPYEQLVVGTPTKVWIYDPDLEQVTVRENPSHNSPAAIISGDLASLKSAYEVSQLESGKNKARFVLSPLSDQENYGKVELTFNKNKLASLSFLDKLEQTTRITFSKTKENGKIKDDLFEFEVPAGADLIVDE